MSLSEDFKQWFQPFVISKATLGLLIHRLCSRYKEMALESEEQFLATPVTKLPTGEERGEYLSIDLGGSNLRIAFINLVGLRPSSSQRKFGLDAYDERIEKHNQRSWPIEASLKNEKAEDLFAWIGDCLAEVIRERFKNTELMPKEIALGIAFSFPMQQSTLSEAAILPMGKGFSMKSNPDLGSMILAGYAPHTKGSSRTDTRNNGLAFLPKIKLTAISNDSVATLISVAYTTKGRPHSKATIGLVLGTGCNAAVLMRPESLHPKKVAFATDHGVRSTRSSPNIDRIVVNTEWTLRGVGAVMGGLGLFSRWDIALDAAISTPGFQPFEYMTAGSYLGELVRLTVYDYLVEKTQLDPQSLPLRLRTRNALTTSWLGWNVANGNDAVSVTSKIANEKEFGPLEKDFWTPERTKILMQAELVVVNRSKTLIAAAIVALLACIGELTLRPVEEHENSPSWMGGKGEESWQHRKEGGESLPPESKRSEGARELIVGFCGGLICIYSAYLQGLKQDLNFVMADFVEETDTTVVLHEAAEGGLIGAGILAGTAWPTATATDIKDKGKSLKRDSSQLS